MNNYEKIYEEWKQKYDAMSSAEQKECLRKYGVDFVENDLLVFLLRQTQDGIKRVKVEGNLIKQERHSRPLNVENTSLRNTQEAILKNILLSLSDNEVYDNKEEGAVQRLLLKSPKKIKGVYRVPRERYLKPNPKHRKIKYRLKDN